MKPTQVTNSIRALRFANGEMTQADLAERIGVTRQTVIAIEQGRYSPSLEMARPSDSSKADVRDRDIARFGEHASRWCVVGGATAGFIGALDHWDYFWIANVIYLGFVLWAVVGSVLRLVAYRRGL